MVPCSQTRFACTPRLASLQGLSSHLNLDACRHHHSVVRGRRERMFGHHAVDLRRVGLLAHSLVSYLHVASGLKLSVKRNDQTFVSHFIDVLRPFFLFFSFSSCDESLNYILKICIYHRMTESILNRSASNTRDCWVCMIHIFILIDGVLGDG